MKCISCEEEMEEDQEMYLSNGDVICYGCYEYDEAHASTVMIYNHPDYENGQSQRVGEHINDTEGEFREEHHYSGWRGYTEVVSDTWTEVHQDAILMGHSHNDDIREFDKRFKMLLETHAIPFAVCLSPTSNCCSTAVGFMVPNDFVPFVERVIRTLKCKYG